MSDVGEMKFRYNSQWMPEQFNSEFDAHIYFNIEQLAEAQKLHQELQNRWSLPDFFVGDLIPRPIGPHPTPMIEVNFSKKDFGPFVLWLSENRRSFSVLVHPHTGDDYRDHTQGAIWLGTSVDIKLSVFKGAK